jgi:hypothetical protein
MLSSAAAPPPGIPHLMRSVVNHAGGRHVTEMANLTGPWPATQHFSLQARSDRVSYEQQTQLSMVCV